MFVMNFCPFLFTGQFIFSLWDGDRFVGSGSNKQPIKSSRLAWPIDLTNCKRNCQDCGIQHLKPLKELGLTTGTKCIVKYPDMKVSILSMSKQRPFNVRPYKIR